MTCSDFLVEKFKAIRYTCWQRRRRRKNSHPFHFFVKYRPSKRIVQKLNHFTHRSWTLTNSREKFERKKIESWTTRRAAANVSASTNCLEFSDRKEPFFSKNKKDIIHANWLLRNKSPGGLGKQDSLHFEPRIPYRILMMTIRGIIMRRFITRFISCEDMLRVISRLPTKKETSSCERTSSIPDRKRRKVSLPKGNEIPRRFLCSPLTFPYFTVLSLKFQAHFSNSMEGEEEVGEIKEVSLAFVEPESDSSWGVGGNIYFVLCSTTLLSWLLLSWKKGSKRTTGGEWKWVMILMTSLFLSCWLEEATSCTSTLIFFSFLLVSLSK